MGNLSVAVAVRATIEHPFVIRREIENNNGRCKEMTSSDVAGFRIDLAVVDPDRPGRYLLGIECDGSRYHSARWARDRDRLRQGVLESRGWTIHRVWSLDWFAQPEKELNKIRERLEQLWTPHFQEAAHSEADETESETTTSGKRR